MGLDSGDPRPAPLNAHPPTAADAVEVEGQLCPPPRSRGPGGGSRPRRGPADATANPEAAEKQVRVFLALPEYPRGPALRRTCPAWTIPESASPVTSAAKLRFSRVASGARTSRLCLRRLSTAPDFMWGTVSGTVGAGMTPWPPRGHPERPEPENLASERELTMPQTQGPRGDLSSLGTDRQTRGPGHTGHCGGKTLWLPRRPWPPASASSAPGAGSAGCRGLGDGWGDIALRGRHVSPWPWATGTVTVPITMRIEYKPSSLLPEI